jgi:hypothetical protein
VTYANWSKPNGVILSMVVRAILTRRFHVRCLLRMTWRNKRETYVFEELGGFRPWLWHVWQWMVDYIEYAPHVCEYCAVEKQ